MGACDGRVFELGLAGLSCCPGCRSGAPPGASHPASPHTTWQHNFAPLAGAVRGQAGLRQERQGDLLWHHARPHAADRGHPQLARRHHLCARRQQDGAAGGRGAGRRRSAGLCMLRCACWAAPHCFPPRGAARPMPCDVGGCCAAGACPARPRSRRSCSPRPRRRPHPPCDASHPQTAYHLINQMLEGTERSLPPPGTPLTTSH